MRPVAVIAVIMFAVVASGCSSPYRAEYGDGLRAYAGGNLAAAARRMEGLQKYNDDLNYPIYMLDEGYVYEWLGDEHAAERYYLTGLAAMGQQLTAGEKAQQIAAPGPGTFYRGDQFEHVFSHVFLGRVYFRQTRWNDARIEFQKAIEMDISADATKEHDVTIAHYLLGETLLQMGEPNDAAVAFRNVEKFHPAFPYGYLEMCRITQKNGDESGAEKYYHEYTARDRNADKIPYDEKTADQQGVLIAFIDLGDGPYRMGDISNEKVRANYPEARAVVRVGGQSVQAYKLDEVLPHARHEAGQGAHTAKQLGLVTARKALAAAAAYETGIYVDIPEEDPRRFDMMPGEFHVAQVPLAPGRYSGQLLVETAAGGVLFIQPINEFNIKAGQRAYVFLRAWTGWHPPGALRRQGWR